MIKVGIIGLGHLGKIHLRCLLEMGAPFQVSGVYDIDLALTARVAAEAGVPARNDLDELLANCDVAAIVTPTSTHFELASKALEAGRHLFIEKPVVQHPEEAARLLELARKSGKVVQVGHVERFNPAMLAVRHLRLEPMFVEAHRLSMFNPRGTDVPVVLDLMIHDIDIVLSLVRAPVEHISASGVAVVSDTPDIANARVEFRNGCVANFTASRISLKQMRKVRLFQKDAYISLDFLKKESQIVRLFPAEQPPTDGQFFEIDTPTGKRLLAIDHPDVHPVNAIAAEWEAFARSVLEGAPPAVGLEEACQALEVAYAIMLQIDRRLRLAQIDTHKT